MKTLSEVMKKKSAVFAFGRMNPPTIGHEKLIKRVLEVAKKNNATPFIFVSHTQDPKKNPLTSKQKIKYLSLGIPEVEKHLVYDPSVKTPFDALGYIEKLGFTDVILVAGSDRVQEMKSSLSKYINHPDPTKSFSLDSFDAVSAGDRDPDADGVSGMSASKMRAAVAANDFASFKNGVPSHLSSRFAKDMFNDLKTAMHIREMVEQVQTLKNTLNIPRREMPQIKRDFIPDFIKTLKKKGINITDRNIVVDTLKPTQNEVNLDKVKEKYQKFADGKEPKPFIVSSDNYILDGHHQLFALKTLDANMQVPCHVVGLRMKDLLKYAHSFPKTTYKNILDK
jgi:hypothetical protein